MNESTLTRNIVKALRGHGAWAVKIHGGPHQRVGLPDIMCIYRGYGIGFEVKMPGRESTLTKIQAKTLSDIRAAGGQAMMITGPGQALGILRAIDRTKDRHRTT